MIFPNGLLTVPKTFGTVFFSVRNASVQVIFCTALYRKGQKYVRSVERIAVV